MPTCADANFDPDLLMQAHELVHVGTWTWEVQSDTVTWSDELFRLFGLEPGSISLRYETYISFVHPDDKQHVARTIASALETKAPFEFDDRIVRPDGEVRVHHSRGHVVCDAAGRAIRFVGACIDITERVREQEALAASEERFRSIFEQSAVGLAVADADTRLTKVNASFARFLRYEPSELVGKSFVDITHPDDVAKTREMVRVTETGRGSYTYEKRYVRRDESVMWGRTTVTRLRYDDGTLDGYMGVVEDITERKLADETLTRQSELLQSIMEHLPVMVSMFDGNGRPIYVNRAWERAFGWTLEEARAIDLFAAVYPDPTHRERARQAVMAGGATWTDVDPCTRDGRTLSSSWACISLSDGTSLTIGQDMTERKQLQERALQAQRMEALGQLAGGVAHDFNNILTVITACATFVQEAVGDNPGVLDDVKEIEAASRRAEALTRQLLAFSRRQMLKPEVVDVNTTIRTLSKTLNRLIGENIQLEIVPAAAPATVEVDIHQLEQVLLNLVVNARDAIRETGTIMIATGNVARGDPRKDDFVAITVSDDGEGIPASVRDRIFEPFFTTKAVGKGTGLGLATVLGIVEQSGGTVEVESTVGVGTTFRVLLPTVRACARPVAVEDAAENLRGLETVLLVEDEAPVRAIARRILVSYGYTVMEARHGADALRLSDNHAGPVHLLITDVVMPEMGGRELSRMIRQRRPGLPILYMSGYTDDELLRRGILETGAQLLRKPFLPTERARVVRQLICGGQGKAAP
ncbi:MAG: PAS domain S-box protein [Gemmatimonadaceae bacterium]